jgi:hypothetical protein
MSFWVFVSKAGLDTPFFEIGFFLIFTKNTFVKNSHRIKRLHHENQSTKDPFGDFYHDQFGVITHFGGVFYRPAII